jgi:hypothetical protein
MIRAILLLAALAACGKKAPTECGKPTATIDGKSIGKLEFGLARKSKYTGAYEVEMFNDNKTTCAEFISEKGRVVPPGQLSASAFAGGDGLMSKGVVYRANTVAGDKADVDMMGDAPKAKGDKVALCVHEAKIEIGFGDDKGKTIVLDGKFEGPYCGLVGE